MSNIVKYDNEFNMTREFNKLSQIEQDIFFSITSEFTKTKSRSVIMTPKVIRSKAKLDKTYRPSEIIKFIDCVSKKLSQITFSVRKDNKRILGSLFSLFIIDEITGETEVKLNSDFLNYFADIPISFTQFELEQFVLLKSKYSKILFRYLMDLKNFTHNSNSEGYKYWKIDFDDFKKLMSFPKSYKSSVILDVLEKSVEEISNTIYFKDLKVSREYGKGRGRPIKNLLFTYQLQKQAQLDQYKIEPILECPYCQNEVVKKCGKQGIFYGHKFHDQIDCNHSWTTLDDLMKEIELIKNKAAEKEKKAVKNKKVNKEHIDELKKRQQAFFEHFEQIRANKEI